MNLYCLFVYKNKIKWPYFLCYFYTIKMYNMKAKKEKMKSANHASKIRTPVIE